MTIFAFLPLVLAASLAQPPPPPDIHLIQGFVRAYNAADATALAAFAREHETADALHDEPDAAFAGRLIQEHARTGDLTLDGEIDAHGLGRFAYLAGAPHHHWYEVQFSFDPSGVRLADIRIAGAIAPPEGIPTPHGRAQIERAIGAYVAQLARADQFSGVVRWESNGAPAYEVVSGIADRRTGAKITPETQFNIASIGKLFTHIAILQLVQSGKLKLTDTLGTWLPAYPNAEARSTVTIAELLDMSSGIGDFFGPAFERADHRRITTLQDYLPFFENEPLAFKPGTGELYSNGGYLVLGLIVEKASGQSYYEYVRTHIFEPAGMKHTRYPFASVADPRIARGYTDTPNGRVDAYPLQPERGSSAGGAYSTARDLCALVRALKNGVLLSPALRDQLNQSEHGFAIAGGSLGTNAVLAADFATGTVVAVTSNLDPPSAEAVAKRIRRWIGE